MYPRERTTYTLNATSHLRIFKTWAQPHNILWCNSGPILFPHLLPNIKQWLEAHLAFPSIFYSPFCRILSKSFWFYCLRKRSWLAFTSSSSKISESETIIRSKFAVFCVLVFSVSRPQISLIYNQYIAHSQFSWVKNILSPSDLKEDMLILQKWTFNWYRNSTFILQLSIL